MISTLLARLSEHKEYHLTDSALQTLKQQSFPGNIRELRNILNRAIVLTDTNLIERRTIEECLNIDSELHQHNSTALLTSSASQDNKRPNMQEDWPDLKTAEKITWQS